MVSYLETIYRRYDDTRFLSSDPVEFPHRYSDPWDQEAVAVIAALLAYGKAAQVRASVQNALDRIGSPAAALRPLAGSRLARTQMRRKLSGWVHRFNTGEDLARLLEVISSAWQEWGSVGAQFVSGMAPGDATIEAGLEKIVQDWRLRAKRFEGRVGPGFDYFLTAPSDGSCCKRWSMLLRWMGRKDRIDPGLWMEGSALSATFGKHASVQSSQLVVPMDTHLGRLSQYLSLTDRRSMNWKAALDVTESLRRHCPEDPVKYDFSLSRLGILELCTRRDDAKICSRCDLAPACRFRANQIPAIVTR